MRSVDTANTMACISEALGIALPGSASPPALSEKRNEICYETGKQIFNLLENNLRPKDILTFEAFENAIAIANAIGGSGLMLYFTYLRYLRR